MYLNPLTYPPFIIFWSRLKKKICRDICQGCGSGREKKGISGRTVFIKSNGKTIILSRNHILYVESQNRMVNFHTANECLELYSWYERFGTTVRQKFLSLSQGIYREYGAYCRAWEGSYSPDKWRNYMSFQKKIQGVCKSVYGLSEKRRGTSWIILICWWFCDSCGFLRDIFCSSFMEIFCWTLP